MAVVTVTATMITATTMIIRGGVLFFNRAIHHRFTMIIHHGLAVVVNLRRTFVRFP